MINMDVKTKTAKEKLPRRDLKPMTLEEYYAMIDRSIQDYEAGRYITTDELLKKFGLMDS